MRKVVYEVACSLDHFIAGAGGDLSWLMWSDAAGKRMNALWSSVDAILMGRKTWAQAAAQGGGESAEPSPIRGLVFSRTLTEAAGAEVVSGDAGAFVRALKAEPGKDIWLMGGGELAASLIAAGVVDEVSLNTHPVLLGGGAPLFTDVGRKVDLALVEAKALPNGCVMATYRLA